MPTLPSTGGPLRDVTKSSRAINRGTRRRPASQFDRRSKIAGPTNHARPALSLCWFDLQYCSKRLVSDRVDKAIGTRFYFANALLQLGEHDLAVRRQSFVVEHHALNVLAGVVAHRTHEGAAFPLRKLVAVIERQPRDRDRGDPEYVRFLHSGRAETLTDAGAVVVAAERHDRPAVVLARL